MQARILLTPNLTASCNKWPYHILDEANMSKPIGQKIALGIAVLSYACAVAFVLAALLYESTSQEDPVRAAFMASVVFFIGCGVVLQVIGTARLTGVLSGSGDIDPE